MTLIVAAAAFGAASVGAFIGTCLGIYLGGLGVIKAVKDELIEREV